MAEATLEESVRVRVSSAEKSQWELCAQRNERTLSNWLRFLANRETEAPPSEPVSDAHEPDVMRAARQRRLEAAVVYAARIWHRDLLSDDDSMWDSAIGGLTAAVSELNAFWKEPG